MRQIYVAALVLSTLVGCGTSPVTGAAGARNVSAVGASKATKKDAKLHKPSFEEGVAAGVAKAEGKKAPTRMRQGLEFSQLSYEYGLTIGLLKGSIRSYQRINGSFDVHQWMSFSQMNYEAMKDARDTIQGSEGLTNKYGIALGILTGGIQSYEAISGSFDVYQWHAFADSNLRVLNSALETLERNSPF